MNQSIENTPFHHIAMITFRGVTSKVCQYFDLMYILKGAVRIQDDRGNHFLDEQDVILLNPHDNYTIYGSNDNLILSVMLDNAAFDKGRSIHTGHFIVDSSVDTIRNYSDLRKLLSRIGSLYFGKHDINNLHLAALGYQLLYYLNANHYEENLPYHAPEQTGKYSDRMNEILAYLHQHYQEQVSLQELADYTHLSSSYLSKFFKKTMETNFNQYLNQIRLNHAVDDLLHTSKSIMIIAQQNGFPNINSFNKIFKEQYQTTPNKYRSMAMETVHTETVDQAEVESHFAPDQFQILEQLSKDDMSVFDDFQLPNQTTLTLDTSKFPETVKPLWRSMLNISSGEQITEHNLEKALNRAKEAVNFQYGRIYHCLSQRFLPENEAGSTDYFNLSFALEMIILADMTPYLELSADLDFMLYPDKNLKKIFSVNLEDYLTRVRGFLEFCITLYGKSTVETWIFEISWYHSYLSGYWENPRSFARRFVETERMIRQMLPNVRIGGFSYTTTIPEAHFREVLEELDKANATPDFMSFAVFPYEYTHSWSAEKAHAQDEVPRILYTSDPHYALHKINIYKNIMHHYPAFHVPVYVNALTSAMHTSTPLNDSCYHASFLAQSTIDLLGEVDLIGYFQLTDLTHRDRKLASMCSGKNGLMNSFGVFKPGLFTLEMFMQSGTRMIEKGENYVLMKGDKQSYCLILCNHLHVNEDFCINPFQEFPITDVYAAFKTPKTQNVNVNLTNLGNGRYSIISLRLNRENGSILDKWKESEYTLYPSTDELNHLKHVVRYKRTTITKMVQDQVLSFTAQLAPHEVAVYILNLIF